MLPPSEALACSMNVLKVCAVKSPIYAANGHRLCIVQLFKRDEKGIDKCCEAEIATDIVTPSGYTLFDGIWAVATAVERELTKICKGQQQDGVFIQPPMTIVDLPMGCAVFGPTIEILPFYGFKEKFEIRDNFLALTRIPRMN